eukprot:595088-Hanusia_phi.AAC.3
MSTGVAGRSLPLPTVQDGVAQVGLDGGIAGKKCSVVACRIYHLLLSQRHPRPILAISLPFLLLASCCPCSLPPPLPHSHNPGTPPRPFPLPAYPHSPLVTSFTQKLRTKNFPCSCSSVANDKRRGGGGEEKRKRRGGGKGGGEEEE